jgi:hypothetical protein
MGYVPAGVSTCTVYAWHGTDAKESLFGSIFFVQSPLVTFRYRRDKELFIREKAPQSQPPAMVMEAV